MGYPIKVTVRYRQSAYHCRFPSGKTASSTMDAQTAVERLMDKTWTPGTHRAVQITPCECDKSGEWAIYPLANQRSTDHG